MRGSAAGLLAAFGIVSGCGALPAVQTALDVASGVVSGIAFAAQGIQAFIDDTVKPAPAVVAQVDSIVAKIEALAASALAAIAVAKDGVDANIAKLIADAQLLYKTLLDLTAQFGVHPKGTLAASPAGASTYEVPPVEAFAVRP